MKIEKTGFRNQGLPPESKEIMRHFGNDAFKLNDHEKRFMQMNAGSENYFIMETREDRKKGRGWCSTCRKIHVRPWAARLMHNDNIICLHCGKRLKVKHSWRLKYAIDDDSLFYLYRPSVIDPAVVTARAVYMHRVMPVKDDFKFREEILVDSFYIFEPGKGATQIMPCYNSRIDYADWYREIYKIEYLYKTKKGASTRDYHYQGTYRGYCRRKHNSMILADIAQAFEAAKDSPIRYGMKEFQEQFSLMSYKPEHFLRFWDWRARYSSVEKLLKIGLGNLIIKKIMGYGYGRTINWHGDTPTKILKKPLTKEDKKYLLGNGNLVRQVTIKIWQRFNKTSMQEAVWMSGSMYALNDIFSIVGREYEDTVIDYLLRQYRKSDKNEEVIISDYRDYLRMAHEIGRDIHSKAVMRPKYLKRAHDETMRDYEAKKAEKVDEALREQLKRYKKYQYSAMGCVVVAPRNSADIINEGIMQHNCVASYIDSVASGLCDIIFVRRVGEEATSYITMEIRKGEIIQARLKFNKPLDKLGAAFVEKFKNERLAKKGRKTA